MRDRGATAIGVAIPHVRSSLPDKTEAEPLEDGAELARPQDGELAHESGNLDLLRPHKLALQGRFAVFQKHTHHFLEVLL